jgi:hypothetical protein
MSAGPARLKLRSVTVTPAQQRDRDEELNRDMRDALNDLISEQVVHGLGTPDDLLRVQVRRVGSDRYRVNVFVGKDFITGRIADSFYLTADGEGNILSSTPEIVRMY